MVYSDAERWAVQFEWVEKKRRQILRQRGFDILDAALIFYGPVLTRIDDRGDYGESREVSTGMVDGDCFIVVHTGRNGVVRLITAGKVVAMTESTIRRASLDDIKRMKDEGKLFPNKGTHEPGEDLGPEFWAKAVLVAPRKPKSVHLKLDPEVFDYFVQITGGKGHLTRMQAVLQAYVEAMR